MSLSICHFCQSSWCLLTDVTLFMPEVGVSAPHGPEALLACWDVATRQGQCLVTWPAWHWCLGFRGWASPHTLMAAAVLPRLPGKHVRWDLGPCAQPHHCSQAAHPASPWMLRARGHPCLAASCCCSTALQPLLNLKPGWHGAGMEAGPLSALCPAQPASRWRHMLGMLSKCMSRQGAEHVVSLAERLPGIIGGHRAAYRLVAGGRGPFRQVVAAIAAGAIAARPVGVGLLRGLISLLVRAHWRAADDVQHLQAHTNGSLDSESQYCSRRPHTFEWAADDVQHLEARTNGSLDGESQHCPRWPHTFEWGTESPSWPPQEPRRPAHQGSTCSSLLGPALGGDLAEEFHAHAHDPELFQAQLIPFSVLASFLPSACAPRWQTGDSAGASACSQKPRPASACGIAHAHSSTLVKGQPAPFFVLSSFLSSACAPRWQTGDCARASACSDPPELQCWQGTRQASWAAAAGPSAASRASPARPPRLQDSIHEGFPAAAWTPGGWGSTGPGEVPMSSGCLTRLLWLLSSGFRTAG